jgi:membrane carboxypeptidase/penicillin-binding protein
VAVKTGTTQNLRDNWTIGYTPDYVAAVWVGNNDNSPMSYVASGITGASPIWNKIMTLLLENIPDKEFPQPDGLSKVEICQSSGTLACPGCNGKWEYFLPGTEPKAHCQIQKKEAEENQKQPPQTISENSEILPTPQVQVVDYQFLHQGNSSSNHPVNNHVRR